VSYFVTVKVVGVICAVLSDGAASPKEKSFRENGCNSINLGCIDK
jgi:hypothetical protein